MRTMTLSNSPVITQLTPEVATSYHGVPMRAIIAGDASFINDGSGVAHLGPKVEFKSSRAVTLKTTVNVSGMDEATAIDYAKAKVSVQAEVGRKDSVFKVDGTPKCRHTHRSTLKVDVATLDFVFDAKKEVVKVKVDAIELNVSRTAKVVKNSLKAMARPNPAIRVFEAGLLRTDWELLCPPEAIKGLWELYLEMACVWASTVVIRTPTDLQPAEAKELVTKFLAANTKEITIRYAMERGEYRRMKATHGADARYTWETDGNVSWTGPVVEGTIFVAMENTPVYLAMGKSSLTPEMLLVEHLVCPELAEYEVNKPAYKRKCYFVQRFLKCLNGQEAPPAAAYDLRIDLEAQQIKFDVTQDDTKIFAKLVKLFPEGLNLSYGDKHLYLDLVACEAIAPLDGDGKAYGFADEICSFFRFLVAIESYPGNKERRVESFFNKTQQALTKAVAEAPRFLAGLLRPVMTQVTKVTTMSSSFIKPWELHVHSQDPRVLDEVWAAGDVLVNARCPVFFGKDYTIVLNDDIAIGLVAVNPLCWHANTKGDADGDTMFSHWIPTELVDVVRKAYAAAGWLGPDAYFSLAGLPNLIDEAQGPQNTVGLAIHDFVENQGKKKGVAAHGFGNGVIRGGLDLFSTTRVEMMSMAAKVQDQYSKRVGKFYGMKQASLWIALACEHTKGMSPASKVASKKALAICGSLYEDLGLAGYNPKAEAFDLVISRIVTLSGTLLFRETEDNILLRLQAFKDEDSANVAKEMGDVLLKGEPAMILLLEECLGVVVTEQEARLVLRARQANLCFADMESGKAKIRYADMDFLGTKFGRLAAIIGMMRRAAKGLLASDSQLEAILGDLMEEGEERKPLCHFVQEDEAAVKYFFGSSTTVTSMVFRAENLLLGAVNARVNERKRMDEMY